MNDQTKQRIREHLSTVMERPIQKRTVNEPFSEADIEAMYMMKKVILIKY
ncbi:hypothetical protein IEC_05378 [Bacillus toyonensis]|nr:hypothetical protein [Bacillus toyonensis]EJQ32366.1 hypothetical protein IEC_05378 [Bacillus toyonensis]